jgi:hypothetical protein
MGVSMSGQQDEPGLWIAETEDAHLWLKGLQVSSCRLTGGSLFKQTWNKVGETTAPG